MARRARGRPPRRRLRSGAISSSTRPESRSRPYGGAQHQRRDDERGDRVGAAEAGGEDHGAGDRGGDEREQVGQEVLEASPRRSASRGSPARAAGWRAVDDDARRARRRAIVSPPGSGGVTRRWIAAVDDQPRKHEQRRAVRLRREDSVRCRPKVRLPPRRPADEPQHDEREQERAGVGEHVRRVREEREGVREDARRRPRRP